MNFTRQLGYYQFLRLTKDTSVFYKLPPLLWGSIILLACAACDPAAETSENAGNSVLEAEPAWNLGAMVTAANPHAVDAGIAILAKGGSAIDAAIAAHAVLGLVEPQSSGLGGGAFMLSYDRAANKLNFIDGRETAPAQASIDMFMKDNKVMGYIEAWQSGKAVGTPGTVALYATAHQAGGSLPWQALFETAIELAENGFLVSPRLAGYLPGMAQRSRLAINPGTAAYFYPEGQALQAGDLLKNPAYAETLKRIASEGSKAFYTGSIAQAIVTAAQAEPNGGSLSLVDLANYNTVDRPVTCGPFRHLKICTTSPPSSGGAQIMIANLYDHLTSEDSSRDEQVAAFVDAQRLAYADRDHYFGDPDEVAIPLDDLLNPTYLEHRAGQRFAPDASPTPGDPSAILDDLAMVPHWSADTTQEMSGTTHLSIIDAEGNAVSMTATIEGAFGSQRWAEGFLLNNEMTDFAKAVPEDGTRLANAVAPNRRPRSSMSPTMVFDRENKLRMVTGSPGGNSIPAYVAKTIIAVLDWGLSAQQAVDYPNIIARGDKVRVEVATPQGQAIADDLNARGYTVQERAGENSGLHVIVVSSDYLDGAADKRREGKVSVLNASQ
jgi:gamma-glutamyltranspeptidase/glutathione hydrolase